MPALLWTMSTPSKSATMWAKRLVTASSSRRSAAYPRPRRPCAVTAATASLVSRTSTIATSAPHCASIAALAAPIPRAPPLTTATFPVKEKGPVMTSAIIGLGRGVLDGLVR